MWRYNGAPQPNLLACLNLVKVSWIAGAVGLGYRMCIAMYRMTVETLA